MVDGAAVSRVGRSLAVVLVAGAILVAGAGPAVGAGTGTGTAALADGAGAGAEGDRATLDPDEVEADRTVLTIRLREDGTAAWTVEYVIALETQEDEQAWNDLQNDIETNTSDYLNRFSSRINSTVATAENDTGRPMSATDYGVETRTQPQLGIVEYSFTWRGFAVAEGDEIRAGDAIDGFLLDQDTRLVMQWPEGYTATTVDPPEADTSRDNAVVWRGSETDFVSGEPRVVVSAASDATTQPPGGGTTQPPAGGTTQPPAGGTTQAPGESTTADNGTAPSAGTAPNDDEGGSDLPVAFLFGLLALAAVAALSLYGYRQRETPPDETGGASAESAGGGGSDSGSAGGDAGDGDASGAAGGAAAAAAAESEDDAVPDEELLSNEERVLKLVRENGGRMKQQEVVDELDWTEAKTSQVVRGLRDEGELEGFRLGRENVLKLPGEDDEI